MKLPSSALKKLQLALFAGATAAMFTTTAHAVVVVVTPASPIAITNSIDGVYFNVVTGASGSSGAAVTGWDINPYNNGGGLTFYGAASPSGILASGTPGTTAIATALGAGATIGPASAGFYNQFQTTAPGFQTAGDRYVGFRFINEAAANQQQYGYLLIRSGDTAGFPAAIVSYAYENTGMALTTPVPEASTFAMFGMGLAAMAFSGLRRRRTL